MGTLKRVGARYLFLVILAVPAIFITASPVFAAQAGGSGSAGSDSPAMAISACGQPALGISQVRAYWASYADYTAGTLSVDESISNAGPGDALSVFVTGTINTNGVLAGNIPITVGTIAGSGSALITVEYVLPQTLVSGGSFKSTVYVFAGDACGNYYNYPGPYPGCT